MHPQTEGVIQFDLEFEQVALPPVEEFSGLTAWRSILHRMGLVGQDPERYEGFGFGNVSCRLSDGGFLISGSQTGGPEWLGEDGFAEVIECDPLANRVRARGPVKPSSESLTHGSVYRVHAGIQSVLHVHSPDIWSRAEALGLPTTAPEIPYGTPAMARAVEELVAAGPQADAGSFAMLGHEDGIVAYGPSVADAGMSLLDLLGRSRG